MRNGIFVSSLKYAKNFDHGAVVSGIARTYSQRGIKTKSEPILPGGKHADLAVGMGESWTYIEVKTRASRVSDRTSRFSFRQGLLREILRLMAHSLRQLPKKQASLMVVATSASSDRRKAISKIKIARSFEDKIFGHDSQKVMGLMIFAPFKNPNRSYNTWRYASALIPNPNWEIEDANLQKLAGIQL